MIKLAEVKRGLAREILDPSGEILLVINVKKRVRPKELLLLLNEERRRKAQSKNIKLPDMSPRTLHKHLTRLVTQGSVRKEVVSHKEVYYMPGPKFTDEWMYVHVTEAVAKLLNSLDRKLGLIEAMRMLDRIRGKPDRMKELENSTRMLCKVFDKELPEPTGENEFFVMRVYPEDEK